MQFSIELETQLQSKENENHARTACLMRDIGHAKLLANPSAIKLFLRLKQRLFKLPVFKIYIRVERYAICPASRKNVQGLFIRQI